MKVRIKRIKHTMSSLTVLSSPAMLDEMKAIVMKKIMAKEPFSIYDITQALRKKNILAFHKDVKVIFEGNLLSLLDAEEYETLEPDANRGYRLFSPIADDAEPDDGSDGDILPMVPPIPSVPITPSSSVWDGPSKFAFFPISHLGSRPGTVYLSSNSVNKIFGPHAKYIGCKKPGHLFEADGIATLKSIGGDSCVYSTAMQNSSIIIGSKVIEAALPNGYDKAVMINMETLEIFDGSKFCGIVSQSSNNNKIGFKQRMLPYSLQGGYCKKVSILKDGSIAIQAMGTVDVADAMAIKDVASSTSMIPVSFRREYAKLGLQTPRFFMPNRIEKDLGVYVPVF